MKQGKNKRKQRSRSKKVPKEKQRSIRERTEEPEAYTNQRFLHLAFYIFQPAPFRERKGAAAGCPLLPRCCHVMANLGRE